MNGDRTHLLIPIHIDALVVGKDDQDNKRSLLKNGTVSAALHYSKLTDFFLTGADLRRPMDPMEPALEPGIHLHFRLPAAVAHMHLKQDAAFPRIPNRWLVQRYYKQGGRLRTKAWLVYSDKEAKSAKDIQSAVVLLVSPPAGVPGDFSGRPTGMAEVLCDGDNSAGTYDYSSDNAKAEVELTAVTGGDAGFSAHYPACRSILGFYDDAADVPCDPQLRLSYLVTGWYSGTEDDPWSTLVSGLKGLNWNQLGDESKSKINEWMNEHGCVSDFANKTLPAGILCHGMIKDVGRQKNGSALTIKSDPFVNFERLEEYWVDLGNTSAEAFAARVAKNRATQDPVDRSLLEDLVTALQIGLFSQGSNTAELDTELHQQGFTAVAGEKTWLIQQEVAAQPQIDPQSPPAALPPLPADLQATLDMLNRLERKCDRHERLLRDYKWELYAIWHRWTDAAIRNDRKLQRELKPNLDALKKYLVVYESEVTKAQQNRDIAKRDLGFELGKRSDAAGAPIKYSLAEKPAAPFYSPKDPVLLLSGPAAQAKGTRLRPSTVTVRITGEELQSFSSDVDQHYEATEQTLGFSPKYLKAIPPWSARLFTEALLMDAMDEIYPPDKKSRKDRETKAKTGVLPDDFSRFHWMHNPWIPLYLYWEVSWQAIDVKGDLHKHWTLKHGQEKGAQRYRRNSELTPIGSLPTKHTGEPVDYKGLSFVGRPLFNLQFARAGGEGEAVSENASGLLKLMEEIDKSLGSRRTVMISQPLVGLNDALIMRRDGDQLPPLDYGRWDDDDGTHALYLDPIRQVLGKDFQPGSSPITPVGGSPDDMPPFCPLRTGLLHLKDLWLLDAFGQRTRVWPEDVSGDPAKRPSLCRSGRLEAGPPSSKYPSAVRLHPRFCRPMRMEFAGISAESESEVAGPVCGWVVLNRFDQNLVLYAANGRPVGILQKRFAESGKTLFYWVAVPGASGAEAEVRGIQNLYLRDFASFVLSLEFAAGNAFAALINDAVQTTEERVPEDNPLISVLIGRPLALVRAELRLEMDGLPALDQKLSWTENPKSGEPSLDEILNTSLKSGMPPESNRFMKTSEVENVRWPVRLGDCQSANDGLVGFFKGEVGSRPFYARWGSNFGNVKKYHGLDEQDLELACDQKLQVTLLMDPQARVHVTSGFLPRVFLELPATQLRGARQVREVFFQAAPVLGTPATPHVPRPSDDYGQWTWAYRPNVTGWAEDPNMVSAAELAGPAMSWPSLTEGWLKLKIEPVLIRSLWMKAPLQKPQKGTNVTLAWSLHGADSVEVFRLRPDGTEEPKPENKWSAPPLASEWTSFVQEKAIFRIKAANKAGYEDYKDIEIETEE